MKVTIMACKSETKEINGVMYSVTQMSAVASVKMLHRVMKVLGPGAPVLANLNTNDFKDPANASSLLSGISTILEKTDEDQFMNLLGDLVKQARVNRDGNGFKSIISLDEEFTGDIFTMFQIAAFVFQVNYLNFSEGSMVSKVLGKAADHFQKESPKKS